MSGGINYSENIAGAPSSPSPQLPAITFVWIKGRFSLLCPAALALQALLDRERIQPALCLDLGCLGCGEMLGSSSLFYLSKKSNHWFHSSPGSVCVGGS